MFSERPPTLLVACPGNVARALAVTGLAAHTDLGKAGVEAVLGRIVIFLHAGRMTLGAHEIPILVQFGPMQNIVVLDLLVRVKMEPALATPLLRSGIPCDGQRLNAAIGKFDQVLLQRRDAKRVFHLECRKLAVWIVGLDQVLSVLAEEARMNAVV